jgi:hypothetical protein
VWLGYPNWGAQRKVNRPASGKGNLEALIGRGQFRFIGPPLKWRGGTGSPIRAVAVFE